VGRFHYGQRGRPYVNLGYTAAGEPIAWRPLPNDTARMCIFGPSGQGKTMGALYLIDQFRQFEAPGRPGRPLVIAIDPKPEGDLFQGLVRQRLERRELERIELLRPTGERVLGFNPVAPSGSTHFQATQLASALLASAFGTASTEDKPRLAKWLYRTAYALIDTRHTLAEAEFLTNQAQPDEPHRRALVSQLETGLVQRRWQELLQLAQRSPKDLNEQLESTESRFDPFLSSPELRGMLSQRERSPSFQDLLRAGKDLYVHLPLDDGLNETEVKILARLLIQWVIAGCANRPAGLNRPVLLVIDEASLIANFSGIARLMNMGRSSGVHVVLICQTLAYFEQDPLILRSILASSNIKMVMGRLPQPDLELLIDSLQRLSYDYQKPRYTLERLVHDPVEAYVTETIESEALERGRRSGGRGVQLSGVRSAQLEASRRQQRAGQRDAQLVKETDEVVVKEAFKTGQGSEQAVHRGGDSHTYGWSSTEGELDDYEAGSFLPEQTGSHRSRSETRSEAHTVREPSQTDRDWQSQETTIEITRRPQPITEETSEDYRESSQEKAQEDKQESFQEQRREESEEACEQRVSGRQLIRRPKTIHEPRIEVASVQLYSLQELKQLAMADLHRLPLRAWAAVINDEPLVLGRFPTLLLDELGRTELEEAEQQHAEEAGYATRPEWQAEEERRRQELLNSLQAKTHEPTIDDTTYYDEDES
jgi:hypothetical protein